MTENDMNAAFHSFWRDYGWDSSHDKVDLVRNALRSGFKAGAAWNNQKISEDMMAISSYAVAEPLEPYQSEADKASPKILHMLERIAAEQDSQFIAIRNMTKSIDKRLDRLIEIAETPTILPQMGSTAPDPDFAEIGEVPAKPDWPHMYRVICELHETLERKDLIEADLRTLSKSIEAALQALRR